MNKTETAQQSIVPSNNFHDTQLVQSFLYLTDKVRERDQIAIQGFAQSIEPLAQALKQVIHETEISLQEMQHQARVSREEFPHYLRKAKETLGAIQEVAKSITFKAVGILILVSLLTSGVATSVYCGWRYYLKENREALKWRTFKTNVFPQLTPKEQQKILGVLDSSATP